MRTIDCVPARKKTTKRENKGENLNIRCTPSQKAELEEAAREMGISVSSFVLSAALEAARQKNAGRS